ncbi:S8 family peptidase [Actinoplanes sp. TRM 88003]|uniref:S8 family peptidase n=1 Tax=Paractinoplanes aksuensis TaxID=2939490 RepID=A0ABT1DQQ9_9ACTN|nr:S8 family peptidase [Actinoplanes aksuensis]MCO8273177.1 S8 family peptidase [Actinoplanes aksuensis]
MKKHLRRYAVGALAIGAIAGSAAIALPGNVTAVSEWQPATSYTPTTYNLAEAPERLLPAAVSAQKPVRVVTTTLDADGRPVIKVTTATSKSAAAKAVKAGQSAPNAVGVELDAVATATEVPAGSDTYRSQQWDFSKIRVADAWTKSTGAGVTVAVLDTGVDAQHPDLAANVLTGFDATTDKAGVSTDANGHGTHVAGTIAAVTGNGKGISAVAPNTKILPVRVLAANGSGNMSDVAEGIVWAADHGATVINMSLGSTSKVTAVTNAITYARSKGVTIVAAAGNERAKNSPTSYPAADAGVIAVAATDSSDKVATYSNAGAYVDVAAPGSGILSTYPTALGGKTGYATMNGTSMASPHVAAVVALLEAYQPTLTPDQIETTLKNTAVDLGAKGRDDDFGAGRIDPVAALTALTPATTAPTSPATTSPTPSATKPATSTPTPTPSATKPTTTTPTPTPTPTKTAPAKLTPTVTVATSTTSPAKGGTASITYTVVTAPGSPWANKSVRIALANASMNNWSYTTAKTNADGRIAFTVTANASFDVKLVVAATDTSVETTSSVTTFTVRSQTAAKAKLAPKPATVR